MRGLRRILRIDPTQRTVGREIDDEIRFHIESRIASLIAAGTDPRAAEARALREFGDIEDARRDLIRVDQRRLKRRWISRTLDAVRVDARQAARGLARRPWFTASVLVILALGIGANATIFSLIDRVFVREPAGVSQPRNVRRVYFLHSARFPQDIGTVFSAPAAIAAIQGLAPRFQAAAYGLTHDTPLSIGTQTLTATTAWVTPGYFRLLGVVPLLGRAFSDDEGVFGDPRAVAIISWRLWQRDFAGKPGVIGQSLRVQDRRATIVGVAPKNFTGVDIAEADVWLPLPWFTRTMSNGQPWYQQRGLRAYRMLARVDSDDEAAALVERAQTSLREDSRRSGARQWNESVRLGSIIEARGPHQHPAENTIALLLAVVALLVLCIACANVGNLLLARAAQRSRETGVRLALGISSLRFGLGLLLESAMLAVAAAAVAVGAASWFGTVLRSALMPNVRWPRETVDGRVLVFSFALTLLTALVAGGIPWLQVRRSDVNAVLKAQTHPSARHGMRTFLLSVQTALSLVLLVGSGLFIRSLNAVQSIDLGYDTKRVITVLTRYLADSTISADDVARLAASMPGVDHVSRTAAAPFEGMFGAQLVTQAGDSLAFSESVGYMLVDPNYFVTAGLRVVRGRSLTAIDRRGTAPVMVVSEAMARGFWPGQDAIGRCLRFDSAKNPCYTVVGVVENSHAFNVIERVRQTFFIPIEQAPDSEKIRSVLIRAGSDPRSIVRRLRGALHDTATGRRDRAVATMEETLAPQYRSWRLGAQLLTIFGALALVVAAFGLYSAVAYSVSTRTRELGVRLALGARPTSIIALILGDGMRRVGIGLACGLVVVFLAERLVRRLLYGTSSLDPVAIVGAVAVLGATAAVSIMIPAWRASRFDPLTVFRSE